jgi:uncharacterized LabA/DUF88 family protein
MRVAIFFDGKNFYSGWKDRTDGRRIDFEKLSEWLVREAGGTVLWGAYYYTAVETGAEAQTEGQRKLAAFLDERELDRGYFVKRFPRKSYSISCKTCGAPDRVFAEKEVDTTMVADMLSLAAVGAFDIAVLVSGDADHAPAVEGVRQLGKKVLVATWAGYGLSPRIRRAAFHHIDLARGLDVFGLGGGEPPSREAEPGDATTRAADAAATRVAAAAAATTGAVGFDGYEEDETGPDPGESVVDEEPAAGGVFGDETVAEDAFAAGLEPGADAPPGTEAAGAAGEAPPDGESSGAWRVQADAAARLDPDGRLFLDELTRALERFRGGYVGLNFFLTRWKSPRMDPSTDARRRILDALKDEGFVTVYDAPDGSKALRLGPAAGDIAARGNGG